MSYELYRAVAPRIDNLEQRLRVAQLLLTDEELAQVTSAIINEVIEDAVEWSLPQDLFTPDIRERFVRSLIRRKQMSLAAAAIDEVPETLQRTLAQEIFNGFLEKGLKPPEKILTLLGKKSLTVDELAACAMHSLCDKRSSPDQSLIEELPDARRHAVFLAILEKFEDNPRAFRPESVLLALQGIPEQKVHDVHVAALLLEHSGATDVLPEVFTPFVSEGKSEYEELIRDCMIRQISEMDERRPTPDEARAWLGRDFTDVELYTYTFGALRNALHWRDPDDISASLRVTQDDLMSAFKYRTEDARAEYIIEIVGRVIEGRQSPSFENISMSLIPAQHRARALVCWFSTTNRSGKRSINQFRDLCLSAL
ncbi:MAG: hypothetical protein AAB384_04295 [Patescibacteria group bacterium]